MILQDILACLAQRRMASTEEIAQLVGSSADATAAMLALLEQRGLVQRAAVTTCGGCAQRCGGAGAPPAAVFMLGGVSPGAVETPCAHSKNPPA
jgi:hypothetical protein